MLDKLSLTHVRCRGLSNGVSPNVSIIKCPRLVFLHWVRYVGPDRLIKENQTMKLIHQWQGALDNHESVHGPFMV